MHRTEVLAQSIHVIFAFTCIDKYIMITMSKKESIDLSLPPELFIMYALLSVNIDE